MAQRYTRLDSSSLLSQSRNVMPCLQDENEQIEVAGLENRGHEAARQFETNFDNPLHEIQEGIEMRESRHVFRSKQTLYCPPGPELSSKDSLEKLLSDIKIQNTPLEANPKLSGWRTGVKSCTLTALSVLIINVVLTIWASTKNRLDDGYGVLYDGSCSRGRTTSTVLHVLINLISTILLGASNYTMQCLHSPTREEVNKAHSEKKWLDIGIPSWRNRRYVSTKNNVLWWCLGLSSVPLHFLYNSAVFLDVTVQEYNATITSRSFPELIQENKIQAPENFTELGWQDCQHIYSRPYVFGNGDVFLMTASDAIQANDTVIPSTDIFLNDFINMGSSISWSPVNISLHLPFGTASLNGAQYFNVSTCYSETSMDQCKIKFSLPIMILVIICNVAKASCMALTVWHLRRAPLVTLGDAIASFLDNPDPITKDLCLITKEDIENNVWNRPRKPKMWNPVSKRYLYAGNSRRWIIVNFLFLMCSFVLLVIGFIASFSSGSPVSAFKTGIGFSPSLNHIPTILTTGITMGGFWGLFLNILVVNTPQAIISFMNLLYNSLFTSLLLCDEWQDFAQRQQPLRVTAPLGEQRSKYYLSIPYRYGIPVLILSGIFHWLISESLFLVRITGVYHYVIQDDSVSSMGYSTLGIVLACLMGFVMLAFVNLKALQKYRQCIPMVGSCSAAVSAACHRPEDDVQASLKAVQWGVVQGADCENVGSWKSGEKRFGHCSFTSTLTSPPIPRRWYAGDMTVSRL